MANSNSNNQQPPTQGRSRARKPDGKFKGDNPETPNLNEAWVPTEVAEGLPKEVDYSIKPKVTGTSQPTAGKYSKDSNPIRPTFGGVTTIQY
jgi:hypothetical protein